MGALHWIGSVRFELRSSDSRALEPVRRALRDEQERVLVQPLQRAFDLADRPDCALRRRRIEIDLGRINPGDLGRLLERRIAEAMRLELAGEPDGPGPAPASDLEGQLIAFLENGHLGWPSPGKALEAICMALAREGHGSLTRLAHRLERLFLRRAETAQRFARQCPLGLVVPIASILARPGKAALAPTSRSPSYAQDEGAQLLAAFILRHVQGEPVPNEEWQYFEAFIAGVPEAGTIRPADGPVAPTVPPTPDGAQLAEPPAARPIPRLENQGHADEDTALPAALCLEAAGTVIIHPFIARLFGACGLLDGKGSFFGEEEHCRAVLLLQFAATGENEAAEPELALAKLLCGMDPEAPVPRSIEPSAAEESEVATLLRAAITHWGALGDSSPEALRETFLKRPGRLTYKNEDWRLEVEAKGVDILIDRLPWPIGLILTPFMTRPLRVDWR